jgi:hypothetical protein
VNDIERGDEIECRRIRQGDSSGLTISTLETEDG